MVKAALPIWSIVRYNILITIQRKKMKLSVIVPVYNAARHISGLFASMAKQTIRDFELIVVDDGSTDHTAALSEGSDCRLLRLGKNRGPAYCRNIGAREASGDILVFTDSDCRPNPDWLENTRQYFFQDHIDGIMGRLELLPSNYIGNSISALGFPAGGAIGFEKIWKVDSEGYTKSLSTCNCAIRRGIFWKAGGFDETFPFPGGEDSLLAYKLSELQCNIKFCRNVLVYHEARDSLSGFMKWQFKRGISSFIFSKRIPKKRNYISLRMWSTKNIISHYITDTKFPMIFLLIAASFTAQLSGFFYAKYSRNFV
jgi:glycosyltransferase involved in cell wall biosynthesis